MAAKAATKKTVLSEGKKGKATPVDKHIGAQLRRQRSLKGFSQSQLAERLEITFQQVQKYENGTNRLSSSKLYEIAGILNLPVSIFFEDLEAMQSQGSSASHSAQDIMSTKETLSLLKVYYSIQNPNLRKNLLNFTKQLAENLQSGNTKK